MRNGNLAGLLAEQASEAGWYDRPAFYAADVVTHGQIHDGAARLGEVLRNRGLSSGDRVLLACRIRPTWCSYCWRAWLVGLWRF